MINLNFEYLNDKGKLVRIEEYEPIILLNNGETFLYLNKLKDIFKFNKKTYLMFLEMFYDIRFTNHTTSSWVIYGTINQLNSPFFVPIGHGTFKPKIKYLFKLSDKGVELYNNLEALLQVEDVEQAKEMIKGYILFKILK